MLNLDAKGMYVECFKCFLIDKKTYTWIIICRVNIYGGKKAVNETSVVYKTP